MKRDFLHIIDFSSQEIDELFRLAARLKKETKAGTEHHLLKGKSLAMVFRKPSARTRVSFETGMWQLGGHAIYLAPSDIGLGTRESGKDLAQVLSRYNDLIMARVSDHEQLLELSEYATVPVVNGLTDYNHPCQVMADIFTILEHRGHLKELQVVFVGDGNNLANSWLNLAQRIPIKLTVACPEGCEPDSKTFQAAKSAGLSEISISHDALTAVPGAHVVYTDTWTSMGRESEAESRKELFRPYQVNSQMMKAAGEEAWFMHCLPAHRGDEVTDEVIDGPRSLVFHEAENRLHIQKAIMVTLTGGDR
ncbi:MAG: ornithine carbamoyltransferase [Candidatus Neomarinimicrobiota bacterium]